MKIKTIFDCFSGEWSFTRSIISKRVEQPSGTVIGQACFKLVSENVFHYNERGQFKTQEGTEFSIEQRYAYQYLDKDKKICKYFLEEGNERRLFYELKFDFDDRNGKVLARGDHLCKKDNYRALYAFSSDQQFDKFSLTYDVEGPKKDYRSTTTFSRILSISPSDK